ncbi:O-antigen polymerase [Pseudomonas azerbaijanoccidentalis]
MMFVMLTIVSLVIVFITYSTKKSKTYLWFSIFLILSYLVDGYFTDDYEYLFFSATYPQIPADSGSNASVAIFCLLTLIVYSMLTVFFSKKTEILKVSYDVKITKKLIAVCFLYTLFLGALVIVSMQKYSLSLLLSNRQSFFEDNLLAGIALYTAPALSVLSFVGAICTRSMPLRLFFILVLVVTFCASLISGSRSTLVLNCILPCIFYLVIRSTQRKGRKKLSKKTIIKLVSACLVLFSLSTLYRDFTRGEQEELNVFVSPDFVTFDSSALIIQQDIGPAQTYLAAFTFLIPRSIWSEKPISGNRYFTQEFFYERLIDSGAEITSSLIGEAYINFRWLGVLSAGALLFSLSQIIEKLFRVGGIYSVLGLIFLFRGTNIIRGDLLNTLVPLFFSFFIFYIASAKIVFAKMNSSVRYVR